MGSSKTIDFVYDPDSDTPGQQCPVSSAPSALQQCRPWACSLVVGCSLAAAVELLGFSLLANCRACTALFYRTHLSLSCLPAHLPAHAPPRPADEIAAEISSEFHLSDTDRDICAAALKEWLDRGMDQQR